MLYPFGIKKKLNEFAALLSVTHLDFHLVTVKNQKYFVYRYEGKLNGIENDCKKILSSSKYIDETRCENICYSISKRIDMLKDLL